MSGSTKSTIDTASEHQIDKLHWKFVEFSRIYKRQKAIDDIQNMGVDNTDLKRYGSFRTLFNVGWGLKAHTVKNFDNDQENEDSVRYGKMKTGERGSGSGSGGGGGEKEKLNPLSNPLSESASASAIEPKKRTFTEKESNTMVSKSGKQVLTQSASVSQILFMTEGKKLYMPSKY